MKRTFFLEDLDCGHCAQKIEDAVSKVEGVSECRVTFLSQKLVYEVEDDKNEAVEAEIKKTVKHLVPDVTLKSV